jgi:Immunoglobulin I-set domain/Protein of unknown function (DUF1573)
MNRFLSTRCCLATLLVVLGFALTASSAAAAPVLQVLQAGTPIAKGSTVTYPSTPTGTPVSILFTIQNNGNANLVINNPTTLVSGSAFFEIVNPTTPISPGGNTVFRVRLQSGAPGTYNGTVTISSNDPVNPSFSFNLVGTVTGPVLSVGGVSNGSTVTFPNTPVGTPTSKLFTIYNNGTANLTLSNPTTLVSGSGFSEIVNPTTPIAPGGNTVFRVRLQSGTAGTYNGTVTIDSNDPVTPVFTFYLVGTVTAAPVVSGPTPASQSVLVGTSVSISVTASGQSPFTYAWSYSTDNVNFGAPLNNGDRNGRITGATSATLQIATTATSDTGYYRCAVSNSYGTTTSASSSLTVTLGTPHVAVLDPNGATAVTTPPYELKYAYGTQPTPPPPCQAGYQCVTYTVQSTGTGTLTLGTPTYTLQQGTGTFLASVTPTSVPPGQTAQLTVGFNGSNLNFGQDFQTAQFTLPTNAGNVVFDASVLWEMRFPEQGLRELVNAMTTTPPKALGLANWQDKLHPDATNPWGQSGSSENLPVVAAAVALWVEPHSSTTQGDWTGWWSVFLSEQTSNSGTNLVNYFKGSELMSNDYTAKVDAAVAAVAAWGVVNNQSALQTSASKYLQAAIGAYALAAGAQYATTGNGISNGTDVVDPALQSTFNQQPMPYVALAGGRSCAGYWGNDQRAPVLCHALGLGSCGSSEEPYQAAVFAQAAGRNPFALTSAQLNSLHNLINEPIVASDVQNVVGLLGSIHTLTTLDFLGWPGVRATCMASDTNGNTPPTLAAAWFASPNLAQGHEADFLYPYDPGGNTCERPNHTGGGTCTIDLVNYQIQVFLGSLQPTLLLHETTPPSFHVQISQSGVTSF